MTFLKREVILRILSFIKANGGRVNRSAVTKGLLHKRYNRAIDLSLKHEMDKFIAVEKRKGIKREDWVLLPDGYRMLGATPPYEETQLQPTPQFSRSSAPVEPAAPAARQISIGISQTAQPVPKAPQIFRQTSDLPGFEPQMVPPHVHTGSDFCTCAHVLAPTRTIPPPNRDDVFECFDGQLLYSDGSKADLTPEQLQAKRRAGKAIRCYPPPSPGMRYDPIAACWRG